MIHWGLGQEVDRLVAFFDRKMRDVTPLQYCVVTNSVNVALRTRVGAVQDAELMLRFRDLDNARAKRPVLS